MRLNHNMASLNIYREHSRILDKQSTSLERISSGYKVNSAKDNPNTIAQSEKLRIQIRGLQMASRNVQDGASMLQTAEGGLEAINNSIQRIRELVVQAGGANTPEDKATIQSEINQMMQGIENFANNTEFNGVKLLNNSGELSMAVGANVGETVAIPTFNFNPSNLGGVDIDVSGVPVKKYLSDIDVTGANGVGDALEIVDASIDQIISGRSRFGALENRFESGIQSINEISDRIEGAESSIRDVDVAEEMMEYAKYNVLIDSGNAMMVQSNKFPQEILKILENVK